MGTFRRLAAGALTIGLMAGLAITAATPAQALTGFNDGGFETPVATPGSFDRFFAPASLGPWTVTEGSVDLIGAGFWENAEGNQSLDLEGDVGIGAVAQTFTTIPLLKYKVSYKLAGNPASGPTIKTGQILANGNVIQNFSFDITGKSFANMGYVGKEAHFIATGLSSTLTFRSTSNSGFGPVIDKVRVESCLLVICLG
jgi:choice-of-anchor C domain-containing protein